MWCYGQILSKLSEWVVQSGHLLPFYHNSAGNVKRQCPLKLVQILAYSILVFVFFPCPIHLFLSCHINILMTFQVKTEMGKSHYQTLSALSIQLLDRDSSSITIWRGKLGCEY